mmetsp:Transcript_24435/g.57843  ORF Transcript_24435/g.57843 Transcript_24435/m.57843 type:complete len:106 (+) Transcript_24435:103-420(+)
MLRARQNPTQRQTAAASQGLQEDKQVCVGVACQGTAYKNIACIHAGSTWEALLCFNEIPPVELHSRALGLPRMVYLASNTSNASWQTLSGTPDLDYHGPEGLVPA